MGLKKIAIVGENAKWVQDLVPILKKGATDGGTDVTLAEFFDTSTSDFSPLFAKVKNSGAQYLIVVLSHASSDIFVKQWHDAQVPIPIGGIDVKSQDADFFTRVSGKANAETVGMFAIRAPLTPKTIPFWDEFVKRFGTAPVYTGIGAYDSVYVYADAVKRANSVEPDAVIKELEKTDHVGIAGKLVFDELHDVKTGPGLQNLLFVQWQKDGARVVVWPKEAATGPMIAPPWMSN
jgi:branched-chain amino acid transport system substrate-binding protein